MQARIRPLFAPLGALLSGALAVLAFAPFKLPLFALLSPALLWWLLRGQTPRTALLRGWCYGLGFFGAGVSWVYVSIHQYGGASIALAAGLTFAFCAALALLFAIQAWLGNRLFQHHRADWLGFALLWWLFEWLRSWFLTGFPWLYLGYAWIDTPFAHWAPLTGVWGISLISILLSAGLVDSLIRRRILPLLPGTLLALASVALPQHWTHPVGTPLKIAIVQPDIPQLAKWSPDQLHGIIKHEIALTRPYLDSDLILWPETAIPAFFNQVSGQLGPFLDQLDRHHSALITGLPTYEADPDNNKRWLYHNSIVVLSEGRGLYNKRRLVPFGEYVPFEKELRGLIQFFDLPMSDFSLPTKKQPLLQAKGIRLAPAICYEIAYPELVRHTARSSDLLVTVSNDTWFGRSIGPNQHLQIARMRALENGRWLIRGTNNGISVIVDDQGKIRGQIPVDQATVLAGQIQPMQGLTPYQRVGVWPLLSGCLLLLFLLLCRRFVDHTREHHRTAVAGLDH